MGEGIEVVITPRMVEAGVNALRAKFLDLSDPNEYPMIARTVFEEMARTWIEQARELSGARNGGAPDQRGLW